MNKYIVFLFFILAFSFSANSADQETITIVADEWCPYNCKPNSNEEGYVVEITKKIFSEKNIKVIYKTLNWNRAIAETKKGTFNAAIAASYEEGKGLLFPSEEIGISAYSFFGLKEQNWSYKNIKSLKGKILGINDGYNYFSEIDDYILKNKSNNTKIQSVSNEDALGTNLNKLIAKRIDLFIDQEAVVTYTINKMKLSDKLGVISKAVYNSEAKNPNFYLAFSPNIKNSQKYIKIFDAGIKKLRKSEELKIILKKYNLTDWK